MRVPAALASLAVRPINAFGRSMQTAPLRTALLAAACRPYLRAGPGLFAYFFARGKLRADPVYRAILERGLLTGRTRILDLGCGQGLLTSWIRAAERLHARGRWPHAWPAPPRPLSMRGIELMSRDVERAHRALGRDAEIEIGDIRRAAFGTPDAVVVLDVLHYLAPQDQRDVLKRIRSALPEGGVLLLRVGDAGGGLRHRYSQWVDKVAMSLRGHAWMTPHCHTIGEWRAILREAGFGSEALPMSRGTPFANVLLVAHAS